MDIKLLQLVIQCMCHLYMYWYNRYWSGLYSRFNELAHSREFAEEEMSSIAQQNVCFDSHISYLIKVSSNYCLPLGSTVCIQIFEGHKFHESVFDLFTILFS